MFNAIEQAFLSPKEVHHLTGIEPGTLANWRWAGKGPAFVKAGRCVKYPKAELERWLNDRLVQPEAA